MQIFIHCKTTRSFAVNKYLHTDLHTVASVGFLFTLNEFYVSFKATYFLTYISQ